MDQGLELKIRKDIKRRKLFEYVIEDFFELRKHESVFVETKVPVIFFGWNGKINLFEMARDATKCRFLATWSLFRKWLRIDISAKSSF